MKSQHLANYLNNHLAGSMLAIELLEYVISGFPSTNAESTATRLRDEIIADQRVLKDLMATLQISQSMPRKAAAWIGEKFAQLKLRLDDISEGSLRLLEATEAVSVGIEGKRLLWISLQAAAERNPELKILNYSKLIRQAEIQRADIEVVRLAAAVTALKL